MAPRTANVRRTPYTERTPRSSLEPQARQAVATVEPMAACSITFVDGAALDVEGELQVVIDKLHEVASRREHSFAVLQDTDGQVVAVRPEAVLHVRPLI